MDFRTVSLIVVSILLFSGCVGINDDKNGQQSSRIISLISTTLSLNYSEVARINYSEVEPKTREIGYDLTNNSGEMSPIHSRSFEIWYNANMPNEKYPNIFKLGIDIIGWHDNNSYSGIMDIDYKPLSNASQLEQEKEYLKDEINKIAQICNLTLNWTNVQFVVSYSD